jgi:hypothetical protein
MLPAPLPDLDALDPEALKALVVRAGANVWSAALCKQKVTSGNLVRANVFGLCWRTALSGPRWDALRSVPI